MLPSLLLDRRSARLGRRARPSRGDATRFRAVSRGRRSSWRSPVRRPQSGCPRGPAPRSAAPNAKSRPTASSQTVASLNACRRGVGLGGSSGAPLRWPEAVVPDQVEGMAPGPAGNRADRDQREDQDSRLKSETGYDQGEAERGREAQSPAKRVALLRRQAVALNVEVAVPSSSFHDRLDSNSARRHSGQPSSSLRASRPAARRR